MFNWDTRLLILGYEPDGGGVTHNVTVDDTVTFSDAISLIVSKALADQIDLSDALVRLVSKTLSDTLTLTDAAVADMTKVLSDEVTFTDALVRSVIKALSDTLTLTDGVSRSVDKSLSDTLTLTDLAAKEFTRSLSDEVTFSDAVVAEFTKQLTDQLNLEDSLSREVSKRLSDQITLSDSLTRQLLAVRATIRCVVNSLYTAICRDPEDATGGLDPQDTTYHADGFYRYDREELDFLTGKSIDRRVQITVDASRGLAGLFTHGEQIREVTLTLRVGYFLGDHAQTSQFVMAEDTRQIQNLISKQSTWGACGRASVRPVRSRAVKVDETRTIWETEIEVQL